MGAGPVDAKSRGGDAQGGGAVLVERQATARQVLRWDWDQAIAPSAPASRGEPAALGQAEAYAALARGDERPLLVLRECDSCRGTTDAFLSRELDNEKTILLGRWFHAVRLPPEVLEPGHPFQGLFSARKPAHLFVATADGALRVDLGGDQSQAQLWSAMTKVLKQAYVKDPLKAVSELRKLLDRLDSVDQAIAQAEQGVVDDAASGGADGPGGKKERERLDALRAERVALIEEGARIEDLQARPRR